MLPVSADENADIEKIKIRLSKLMPKEQPNLIRPSQVPGLYEVFFGPSLVYTTSDGRYLISGDIIDIDSKRNITKPARNLARLKTLSKVNDDKMIVFPAKDEKFSVMIFTDIDCGYCRKLHNEMDQYNAQGITVKYLFFPRSGIGSDSYRKAESVWCADSRLKAMTDAKNGRRVNAEKCENPVSNHMALGEAVGVSATPTLVLNDGELMPGYLPAEKLAQYLQTKKIQQTVHNMIQ